MSEPKPKSSNTGLIIALIVGVVLVVPCVLAVVGLAVVGGGMAVFLGASAPDVKMEAMPGPMPSMEMMPVEAIEHSVEPISAEPLDPGPPLDPTAPVEPTAPLEPADLDLGPPTVDGTPPNE